jgi:hypothetical protein
MRMELEFEIRNLRIRLQQAQEELLVAKRSAESWQETANAAAHEEERDAARAQRDDNLEHLGRRCAKLEAELEAAIVRGKLLWDGLGKELAAHLAGFYTPIMLDLVTQKNAAIVRAEAAEALAERLQGRIGTNTTGSSNRYEVPAEAQEEGDPPNPRHPTHPTHPSP